MSDFNSFKDQVSSEKLVLATMDASKRLMGWTLHSGSIYKLTGITYAVLKSIEDSGTTYTSVGSIAEVIASKYYYDIEVQTLYVRTTGSDNPNGRFIVATFRFFFANAPIVLPHDLSTGFEVYWENLIKSNSQFGVEIDTIKQTSEAIEGSGSLVLINDQDFWPANFDKLTFENKDCSIYSYNRDLDVSEARLLFKGMIEKRSYNSDSISFSLKDLLSELRTPLALSDIQGLGLRNDASLNLAKQRMIFGRVFGHRPTNVDAALDGYPLTGTVSVLNGSNVVTGTGTSFLKHLSPDDQIVISGTSYSIASVASDTSTTITDSFSGTTASGITIKVKPALPKRFINRIWKVAGHALKEPVTNTKVGSTITKLLVDSTENFFDGDTIYVGTLGSGELAVVSSVLNSNTLNLSTSLNLVPNDGVAVTRPAIQNVSINNVGLIYYRDYTFDATTSVLTLRETAEGNASNIKQMSSNLVFTSGSRTVTGSGLDAILKPGFLVGVVGNAEFFEVSSVDQTSVTLKTTATFTANTTGRYKPFVFDDQSVLSCDCFGRTIEGTKNGTFIRKGAKMVKTLLTDLGLTSIIDIASFDESDDDAQEDLGLVIPEKFADTKTPTYRDVINLIGKSINGNLIQTQAFKLSYFIILPNKLVSNTRLSESDILSFSLEATAENVVKTVIIKYQPKEYDKLTSTNSIKTQQKTSDNSNFIVKTDRTKTIDSKLVNTSDAEIYANRWAVILETSAGTIKFTTKLNTTLLEVGDVIDLSHRKLFVRLGGEDKRRLMLIEKITKDGYRVSIEAVDLSNLFNRSANVATSESSFVDASDEEKIYGGFITDEFGMISNDPKTFGLNIIY